MQPDLGLISIFLFYLIGIASLALSFARGGAPEVAAASILIGAFLFQAACYALAPPRFIQVDGVSLLTDLICLIGFGWLALDAKRIWPLWATAFLLVGTASHIARLIELEIEPLAYSIMRTTPTACVMILMALGSLTHRHRLRRYGEDSAWTDWERVMRSRFVASKGWRFPD